MKTIITIQHTQSEQHTNGMIGSWTDWPLTKTGKEQAEEIGKRLFAELSGKSCKIYCSDLLRAKQTAEPLARYFGLPIEYRKELREINHGEACGKTKAWGKEHFVDTDSIDVPEFADAETWREFWNRVSAVQKEISETDADFIIVVSHGGTLKVWSEIFNGAKPYRCREFGKPGSITYYPLSNKDI